MTITYFILLQVFVAITQARPQGLENVFKKLLQYDANLDPGFDINAFRTEQLNLHNHYRALHGVPLMTLDQTLTNQAQAFAEQEAAIGKKIRHCKDVPGCDVNGAGENLYEGSTGQKINPTKLWYSEFDNFDYCRADDATKTRPGHENEVTGHFTQVVWKDSVHFGIGYAQNAAKTKIYIVARYKVAGNLGGQYTNQVTKPSNIGEIYQDNCNAINGGYSSWSTPGECTVSCGGGVRLLIKYCNNPKPSLNGRDCTGDNKQLAAREWCNIQSCPGTKSHRDKQCEARGYTADSHIFSTHYCTLYCMGSGGVYMGRGTVDDGTQCNNGNGACVLGVCKPMPAYAPPQLTSSTGDITGFYNNTPSSNLLENIILVVPNGASNIIIKNRDYHNDELMMGYKNQIGNSASYAVRWLESWNRGFTIKGVQGVYQRLGDYSKITIAGPVQPGSGFQLVLLIRGNVPAQIEYSYSPPSSVA